MPRRQRTRLALVVFGTAVPASLRARIVACAFGCALALPAATAQAETMTVNSTLDQASVPSPNFCQSTPSGVCTLRAAMQRATANGDADDVIFLPAGLYQLTHTMEGDLDALAGGSLAESLTIVGAGARNTRIAGTGSDRVLDHSNPNLTLSLSGVTISDGRVVTSSAAGGGIRASGPLTLTDSAVVDSRAESPDNPAQGGGIYAAGGLTLTNVTLKGNVVSGEGALALGGGLYTQSTAAFLLNSTISGNVAEDQDAGGTDGSGAGVYNVVGSGATQLRNVTIAGNTVDGTGGGIAGHPNVTFVNTIVALNRTTGGAVSNCAGAPPGVSAGNNLDETTGCGFTASGDQPNTNPLLGPLANNGGQTDTRALLAGSPAIDAGTNTGCPGIDQRGVSRPQNGVCDIGAFEFAPSILPPPPPDDDALPPPVLGRTFNVRELSGRVFFAIPASASVAGVRASQKGLRFRPLREARQLPVGSFLNTRRGKVRLTSARPRAGATQSGVFTSGLFQLLQSRKKRAKGLTELRLKGSSFRRCKPRPRGKQAQAAISRRRIRRLRANARGRFRTRGRYSAATVRGTKWLTVDRCDGTLTKVTRGRVAVRDFRRKRTITLKRGKSYLAKARARR